jgi:signal transduction histidine kinase
MIQDINQNSESGAEERCPVTGLPLLTRPEWTNVRFGESYTITARLIGDHILYLTIAGYATLPDIREALVFTGRILSEEVPDNREFVLVEDMTRVLGTSREARDYFIDYMGKRERLRCLVFYGISPLFRLNIKLGRALHRVPFNVEMATDYVDAVTRANAITADSHDAGPVGPPDKHPEDAPRPGIIERPDWRHQDRNYSIRYEVIDDHILHSIVTGRLEARHIEPAFQLAENVVRSSSGLGSAESRYYVMGLTEAQAIGQKVRKSYSRALMTWYDRNPSRMIVFYGATGWLKMEIALARRIARIQVKMAPDLDSALALVAQDEASASKRAPRRSAPEPPVTTPVSSGQIPGQVDDLLRYIEGIDWEIGGVQQSRERDSSNPFWPVFDAIDLIKWELDGLLSERKRAESELTLAKETAEDANRAKGRLLANMSHELRTPLNHIIGFTELMADGKIGPVNEDQIDILSDVLKSSGRLLNLIDDILDLSIAGTGHMELELSELKTSELLNDAVRTVSRAATLGEVSIQVESADPPATIVADREKINKALHNLMTNAIKYDPGGGVILRATGRTRANTTTSSDTGQLLVVSVTDSGTGIQRGDLKRVFQLFERVAAPPDPKTRGTGLGLTVVREIVELHGGRVWAESDGIGKGSTFVMEIPVNGPGDTGVEATSAAS